ncbi:unnamed protein product [Toxocara canis]|uniref:Otopetrin-2 n=1 Tax=Toxocara canis TaxID=6265 RepID=A0A183V4J9_TOXCA|nr:unnamed protein product [Toxocara canis]
MARLNVPKVALLVTITGSRIVARFGTMHLIAANLWTWIRYILIEESVMNNEISRGTMAISADNLGSMTELMYTSIVEYSLIGAAVMFIVWHNIDQVRERNTYVKRKYQIRVDCSKTTSADGPEVDGPRAGFCPQANFSLFENPYNLANNRIVVGRRAQKEEGLFFGLLYLSATLTSMAIFYGYMASKQSEIAATVYGITDVVQYIVSGAGCIYALWRMRLLRFAEHPQQPNSPNSSSQELLDLILLSLGLIGELIYSASGLLGLTAEKNWQALTFILLAMHILRLLQSGIQASLIFIAGKLRIQGDDELHAQQPGKQTITFLLVANISMFLTNLFEAEKAGISETVVNFYGKRSWVFLVRSFGPLTIFFRFHSSVCLAEIWKNVYAWKSQ